MTAPTVQPVAATTMPIEALKGLVSSRMTEAQFQALVIEMATDRGWKHHHHYDSRRSTPGWPDLILIKGERMIAWELKKQRSPLPTAHQIEWLQALSRIPGVTAQWLRPDELDYITKELSR